MEYLFQDLLESTALSGLNIIYPFMSFIHAIAIMLAAGGSAIVAIRMGEGKNEEARRTFSLIVYSGNIFRSFCCSFWKYIYK